MIYVITQFKKCVTIRSIKIFLLSKQNYHPFKIATQGKCSFPPLNVPLSLLPYLSTSSYSRPHSCFRPVSFPFSSIITYELPLSNQIVYKNK